jgi:hypothetical protein
LSIPSDPPRHRRRISFSGESKHVVFIHHVDGLYIEDVTNELFDEAEAQLKEEYVSARVRELQAIDHARDLRKHEVV